MKLILPIKALSYNAYYKNSKTGKRIKTGAGHAYDEELELLLSNYAEELRSFGKKIDLSKNIVEIEIYNYKSNFYRKDGELSKTAGDWDNPIKVLQDKIFKLIEVDDYIVKSGEVRDIPSSDIDGVIVYLSLLFRPKTESFNQYCYDNDKK